MAAEKAAIVAELEAINLKIATIQKPTGDDDLMHLRLSRIHLLAVLECMATPHEVA